MIAALFVQTGGVYFDVAGVEPWDLERDARRYAGPHAVVAHPPCQRWGRYWHGGPSAQVRQIKGDDGGCFLAALEAVRRWGGVLEHPEASAAWQRFDLNPPPFDGGWITAGMNDGGWTCRVEQGHYGHRAKKATWLYAHGVTSLPSLRWGPSSSALRLDGHGFHDKIESAAKRRQVRPPPASQRAERAAWLERYAAEHGRAYAPAERLGATESAATPLEFRDLLLAIARAARPSVARARVATDEPSEPAELSASRG